VELLHPLRIGVVLRLQQLSRNGRLSSGLLLNTSIPFLSWRIQLR